MEGSDGPVHAFNPFRTFVVRNYKARMLMVKDPDQNLVVSLLALRMDSIYMRRVPTSRVLAHMSSNTRMTYFLSTCLHAHKGILAVVFFEKYLNVYCLMYIFSISLDFHLKFYEQNRHDIRTTRQ